MRIAVLLMICCMSMAAAADRTSPAPRLVLFIMVDDLRPTLGCYDDPLAHTPHMDALANEGVRFERAYVQQALCAPSRMSVLSGLRPETIGIHQIDQSFRSKDQNTQTLPQFMRQVGYTTVSLGKVYHHDDDDADAFDINERRYVDRYLDPENIAIHGGEKEKTDKPWKTRAVYRARAWENPDVPDEAYEDHEMTTRAIELIAQAKADAKPVFMAVGYRRPHLPFNAPKRYWDLFNPAAFTLPPGSTPEGAPNWAMTNWGELRGYHGIPQNGDLSPEQTRDLRHAYYACVSYVDAQVGRLLTAVDEQGLRDQTMIVLWGDHGYKLGEYGDWCKHTNLEIDTRVPLVIRGPGIHPKVYPAAVEALDIYPTIAEMVGQQPPAHAEGRSLREILTAKRVRVTRPSYAMSVFPKSGHMGYSITDGLFRYTAWFKGDSLKEEELYDHRNGPLTERNVINDRHYSAIYRRLKQALEERR